MVSLKNIKKSLFLLGPRQTGKSTMIKNQLPQVKKINLLQTDVYLKYSTDPSLMRKEITEKDHLIIIDEVQKLPQLKFRYFEIKKS